MEEENGRIVEVGNSDNEEGLVWGGLPPASDEETKRIFNLISMVLGSLENIVGKPLQFAFLARILQADESVSDYALSSLPKDEACEMLFNFAAANISEDGSEIPAAQLLRGINEDRAEEIKTVLEACSKHVTPEQLKEIAGILEDKL